jgi:nicotinamidase-related amidase
MLPRTPPVLIGGHTDVCVHYTFVDGHQHDYFCRVVEDCVAGSSLAAHAGALNAMEYLQTGARRSTVEMLAAFDEFGRTQAAAGR